MAMLDYNTLVSTSHFYAPIVNSVTAKNIYASILSADKERIEMVEAIESGRPAIYAVAKLIEDYCANDLNCDIDLANDQVRQCFGRLVAEAVRPFGYLPKEEQSKGSLNRHLKYFKTGKKYELTGTSTETIVKTIVTI